MTFSTFTVLCNYRDCLVLEHFFTQKQTCVHEAGTLPSFLFLAPVPYFVYLLINTWVVSTFVCLFVFWLLSTMLLWTFVYQFLCGPMFLLGIYLGVALLGRIVILFDLLRNHQTVHSGCHILYSSQQHCSPTPPSLFQDLSHLENGTPT